MRKAGPSVIKKLRASYKYVWGKHWPHDDAYLSELWFEAKEFCRVSAVSKKGLDKVYVTALEYMRYDA